MSPVDPNDLAHNQMDDDGAPPAPERAPLRIGIAPAPDVRLTEECPGRTETLRVVFADSEPVKADPGTDAANTLKLVGSADAEVVRPSPITPEVRQALTVVGAREDALGDRLKAKANSEEPIILKDVRPARERKKVQIPADENGPSRLVFANGSSIHATSEPVELVGVTGETLNSLTWPAYLAWRKTKCRRYDYEKGPRLATDLSIPPGEAISIVKIGDDRYKRYDRDRALEEIDQATLEFIGEVAELGDLFREHGPTLFFGEKRDKLIDECGDIFFCGAWALDAWGMNPLAEMTEDLELMRVADNDDLAAFAGAIAGNDPRMVLSNARFISMLGGLIFNLLLGAQSAAGLTANSFKKLKYQRREQDVKLQVEHIITTLFKVNQILIVANSSVEEALKSNMRKLDARYPNGYQPGQGGGIRTGEGA